ncbi:MAG: hypothetical protein RIQ89_452 [Bacteroidota bacterium]
MRYLYCISLWKGLVMILKSFILTIALLLSFKASNGQFGACVDSTRIDAFFNCGQDLFDPVCACNGKTYRSPCDAYNRYGINQGSWVQGTCENYFFDFNPNPVGIAVPKLYLYVNPISLPANVTVFIFDPFSGEKYRNTYFITDNVPPYIIDSMPVEDFKKGLYILFISVNGEEKTKKFVKVGTN